MKTTKNKMTIFIYKRTRKHDPDENGKFGVHDCMGRLRNVNYDAVIGIGAVTAKKDDIGIKGKINWAGLGPKMIPNPGKRSDAVIFAHFKLYDEKGADIKTKYPNLYNYMYKSRCRFVKRSDFPPKVQQELDQIISLIKKCPPSKGYNKGK